MIDLFSVLIEYVVTLVLRLGWSDARSRRKVCRFVLVISEVRCLFLILLADTNGNEALSCQNMPFRVYVDSYVLRWRSVLHMLLTLQTVLSNAWVHTGTFNVHSRQRKRGETKDKDEIL